MESEGNAVSAPKASPPDVILIAPNVSEQMGGEAIKALQIYQELDRQGVNVHYITHQRVEWELSKKFPNMRISYAPDSKLQHWIWKGKILRPLERLMFQWRASRMAGEMVKGRPGVIVHFTSPVSPVQPCGRVPGAIVVVGPQNGNIFYPPGFRHREEKSDDLRRRFHPLLQFAHRIVFRGKRAADAILVAGGERTFKSLKMAGCKDSQLVPSIDSGIQEKLFEQPRVIHRGENMRFVHNGRLTDHKGADLAIRAAAAAKNPVVLDIIGRGVELPRLRALADELGVAGKRVNFIEWFPDHNKLGEALRQYRAFVFPSLAEANGIVVQEAMMMGLPVICLNWGGPALLVTPECGVLVEPKSEEQVVTDLAAAMDRLATDGELADRMAAAGRARAESEGFRWPDIIQRWRKLYDDLRRRRGLPVP